MRARLGVLATGVGVALGAVAAAGAAGALPDPIQAPVSGVLEAVTPQQPSDPAEDTPTPVELPVTEEAAADPADLGGQVSEQARESPAGRGTDRGNG
jgi:hypothetical protein